MLDPEAHDGRTAESRLRRWVSTAPWWQLGAAQGVFFALVSPLVQLVLFDVPYGDGLAGGVVAGVLFGLTMGWLIALQRGRMR